MRWLKHLSCAHEDELMAELIEEFGPEGYGVCMVDHSRANSRIDG